MNGLFAPTNQQFCNTCGAPMLQSTAGWIKTCQCVVGWNWTAPVTSNELKEQVNLLTDALAQARAEIARLEAVIKQQAARIAYLTPPASDYVTEEE
jgi:hypothetical protein